MAKARQGGRAIKRRVLDLLKSRDFDDALDELFRLPASRVISPLFSFLYNSDEEIKWAAVSAMGAVVAKVADEDLEAARIIMRRLMWNLNDESGGIGWGSPEAMGEILANHQQLAGEFGRILISYTRKDGNYLENERLQRGLLWGIGRLSQSRPELVKPAIPYLMPYLASQDASVRGIAAWVIGWLGAEEAGPALVPLKKDEAALHLYIDRQIVECKVGKLAEEALERLSSGRQLLK
jgi:HEAT repeat protein